MAAGGVQSQLLQLIGHRFTLRAGGGARGGAAMLHDDGPGLLPSMGIHIYRGGAQRDGDELS